MIEDALFLGLGFCIATVIALACVPILWARALRLTGQRLEALVPLSVQEIDAERDGLRAKAAVIERRLEQELERNRQAAATLAIDLGHRTVSLVGAETVVAELRTERTALLTELKALGRDLRDSEAQCATLQKALHDADCRIESAALAASEQADLYDQVLSVSEQRRATIAALETRVAGLTARLEERDERMARLTLTVTDLTDEREALTREQDAALASLADLRKEFESTNAALSAARKRGLERDRRLRRRARLLTSAEAKIAEQTMTIQHGEQALAALQIRFDLLEAELTRLGGEGAGDAVLRDAIVAAGDEALRLLTPSQDPAATDPGPRRGAELVGEQRP